MLDQALRRRSVGSGAAPVSVPHNVGIHGIATHYRAVVIVDSIAGHHRLADWTRCSRLYGCWRNAGNVARGGLVSCLSRIVNVLPEFLRGHKVHSQDQKETKRYDFDFSQGK